MMPPSTNARAPPASTASPMDRPRAGETAFASTYTPAKPVPATRSASAAAASGGQTLITVAEADVSCSRLPASWSPADSARSRVAALRPSLAQSTRCPRPASAAPTDAPIAPGWRRPMAPPEESATR